MSARLGYVALTTACARDSTRGVNQATSTVSGKHASLGKAMKVSTTDIASPRSARGSSSEPSEPLLTLSERNSILSPQNLLRARDLGAPAPGTFSCTVILYKLINRYCTIEHAVSGVPLVDVCTVKALLEDFHTMAAQLSHKWQPILERTVGELRDTKFVLIKTDKDLMETRSSLRTSEQAVHLLTGEVQDAERALESAKVEISELLKALGEADKERVTLQRHLDTSDERAVEMHTELSGLKDTVVTLRGRDAELERTRGELDKIRKLHESARDERVRAERVADELRRKLDVMKQQTTPSAELRNELAETRKALGNAKAEIETLQKDAALTENNFEVLKAKAIELRAQDQALFEEELAKYRAQISSMSEQQTELRLENDDLKMTLSNLRQDIGRLRSTHEWATLQRMRVKCEE